MKTFNVWNLTDNRWTDYKQHPTAPQKLSFEESTGWCQYLNKVTQKCFETRELAADGITSIKLDAVPTTQKSPIMKTSDGISCKHCRFFNEYAEANQTDGSYVCFSCR